MLRKIERERKLVTTLCGFGLLVLAMAVATRGGHLAEASPSLLRRALPPPPDRARHRIAIPAESLVHGALDVRRVQRDASGFVQVMPDGGRAELTLDPGLQEAAERVLASTLAPQAAAVVLSVDDGRVLALTGRRQGRPEPALELATGSWAPAASVFKLVTAAALVESGLGPDTRVCYHDGVHSVEASNLEAHPKWDRACNSLAFAVAKSQNAIIARLAHEHLDPLGLGRAAQAFGFGAPLPFELPTEASRIELPRDNGLELARAAAGFWHSTLSPLHGAYLAATLARGGVTPPLRLVDRVVASTGESFRPEGAPEHRAVSEAAAREVGRMMVGTTQYGTARLGFHDRKGRPLLPGVAVAGKTGSLNRPAKEGEEFLAYSWFVGFAPAEKPEVAIAVLVGNGESWHKKASNVAAELLAAYFHGTPRFEVASR